jgi:hypothetical protein
MTNLVRAAVLASLTFIPALAAQETVGQDKQPSKEPKHIEYAYYPLKEGSRWVYDVRDNKTKDARPKEQVAITVASKETFPIKVKSKDALDRALDREVKELYVGFKLKIEGGGKVLDEEALVREDGVYRLSSAGKTITPPVCFLKAGLKKGETWTVDSQSENAVLKGKLEFDEEKVTVPAGTYDAIVVRCDDFQIGGQTLQVEAWYAAKVGMVKQRVRIGQHDVTLELEKFEASAK